MLAYYVARAGRSRRTEEQASKGFAKKSSVLVHAFVA
jgi:hypothetical protein